MIITINKSQIIDPVIIFNRIKVMNHLVFGKGTTKMFSHYEAMLKNITVLGSIGVVWFKKMNISLSVYHLTYFGKVYHFLTSRKIGIALPTKLRNWRLNTPTRWTFTISIYFPLRLPAAFNFFNIAFRSNVGAFRTQLFLKGDSFKRLPTPSTDFVTTNHTTIISHKGEWCPYVTRVTFCQEGDCKGCQIYLARLGADRDKKQDALKLSVLDADIQSR